MNLNDKLQKMDIIKLIRREGCQILDKLESLGLDTVPRNQEDLDAKSLDYRKYGRFEYMRGNSYIPDVFLHYGLANEKNFITDVVIVVKNAKGDKFLFCIEDYTDEEREYQVIRRIEKGNQGKIHLLAESFKLHDSLNRVVKECWEDIGIYNPVLEGFIDASELKEPEEGSEPIIDDSYVKKTEDNFGLIVDKVKFEEAKEAFDSADIEGKKLILMYNFFIIVNNIDKTMTKDSSDIYEGIQDEVVREIRVIKQKDFRFNLIEYIKNSKYYDLLIQCVDQEYRSYERLTKVFTRLIFKYR